jgi:hypothetical protein
MPRSSPRTFLPAEFAFVTEDDRARHTAVQLAAAKQGVEVAHLYVPYCRDLLLEGRIVAASRNEADDEDDDVDEEDDDDEKVPVVAPECVKDLLEGGRYELKGKIEGCDRARGLRYLAMNICRKGTKANDIGKDHLKVVTVKLVLDAHKAIAGVRYYAYEAGGVAEEEEEEEEEEAATTTSRTAAEATGRPSGASWVGARTRSPRAASPRRGRASKRSRTGGTGTSNGGAHVAAGLTGDPRRGTIAGGGASAAASSDEEFYDAEPGDDDEEEDDDDETFSSVASDNVSRTRRDGGPASGRRAAAVISPAAPAARRPALSMRRGGSSTPSNALLDLQVKLARAEGALDVYAGANKDLHAELIASREGNAVLKEKNRRLKDDKRYLQEQWESEIRVSEAARDGADEARCELKKEKRLHRYDVQDLQRQLVKSKEWCDETLLAMQHEHEKDLEALKRQHEADLAAAAAAGRGGGGSCTNAAG